ncbi:MAG: DUF5050 domain-containing protein, partial [Clostridia bacterium]|nr:DUF5050 domain-containing protein [Clostridia bacterium]
AYDAYGKELGQLSVSLTDLEAAPKEFFAVNKAVSLEQFPEAKHITADFLEVHFAEGEPYIKGDNLTEVKITEPDFDEQVRLMTAAGEDAVCYAKEEASHWLCVCGRPNLVPMDSCVRCGRDKAEVLSKFSSHDAITKELEELEAQQKAEEDARLQAELARKQARRKKQKKAALISAAVVASLLILYIIGRLVFSGVSILLGNSAAKKNDYFAAYKYYLASGSSKKIATVSEEVRGNSFSNLNQSGIMTSDDENLYYIDFSYSIYKESKATGEKTRLGDAAGMYLNVADGWVYYLDATKGKAICRISTDGKETQVLYENEESTLANISVVGNELYFVSVEQNDKLTPEMQEYMAQTGDSSMMYRYRLYRMKIGAKKPKVVSDQDVAVYTLYKDKIYYMDLNDQSIYSMNRKGNDIKKLVSGPVYGYELANDSLYYLDGTIEDEATGIPKLSLEVAELDGTYRETVLADRKALNFAVDGETIYWINFEPNTEESSGSIKLCKQVAGGEAEVIDNSQMFNYSDGYVVYVRGDGQLIKSTFDKSGYEPVVVQSAPTAPVEETPVEEAPAETEAGEEPTQEPAAE